MRITLIFLLITWLLVAEPGPTESGRIRIPLWSASVQSIEAGALTATVGGHPASVARLQSPDDDLMILLVLDLTEDLNEIDMARAALADAVAEAPPNAYIGVMRAQNGLTVLEDPTSDREAVVEAVESFSISGTPGLLETIEAVSDLADSLIEDTGVRIAVFYVTDSEIDEYREDFTNPVVNQSDNGDMSRRFPEGLVRDRISRLDTKLGSAQAPIFVVHLNYETDRADEAYQNGILQMATTTGGDATFCRSNAEIAGAIEAMMRKIVTHYSLDLEVPKQAEDTVEIALESAVEGDLDYRTRYQIRK
jgi:hypothetical protein